MAVSLGRSETGPRPRMGVGLAESRRPVVVLVEAVAALDGDDRMRVGERGVEVLTREGVRGVVGVAGEGDLGDLDRR